MLATLKKISIRVMAILMITGTVAAFSNVNTNNIAFECSTAYARSSRMDRILDDMFNEFRRYVRNSQRDFYDFHRGVQKDYYNDKRAEIREARRNARASRSINLSTASANEFRSFANTLTDSQYACLQKLSNSASDYGIHEVPCSSNAEYSAFKSLCNKIDGYRFVKGVFSRNYITAVQIERY